MRLIEVKTDYNHRKKSQLSILHSMGGALAFSVSIDLKPNFRIGPFLVTEVMFEFKRIFNSGL